jgi:hypothetical protein
VTCMAVSPLVVCWKLRSIQRALPRSAIALDQPRGVLRYPALPLTQTTDITAINSGIANTPYKVTVAHCASMKTPAIVGEDRADSTDADGHARRSIQCPRAGVHVQVEIPLADNLGDAEAIAAAQKDSG